MIGSAISGMMMAGITSMLYHGNLGVKALQEKIDILQTQQDLLRDLADSAICGCNFDPSKNTSNGSALTFDSTDLASAAINLKTLYSACVANVPGRPLATVGQPLNGSPSRLQVESIELAKLEPTGTGLYKGQLKIKFDSSKMALSRKPATVSISLAVDTTIAAQARITGCSATTNPSGAGALAARDCKTSPPFWHNGSQIPDSSVEGTVATGACNGAAVCINGAWAVVTPDANCPY